MSTTIVYYIGGPWDLHKVALPKPPAGDQEVICSIKQTYGVKGTNLVPVPVVNHVYMLRPVAHGVFVALHSDLA